MTTDHALELECNAELPDNEKQDVSNPWQVLESKLIKISFVVRSKQVLTGTCIGNPRGFKLCQTIKDCDVG